MSRKLRAGDVLVGTCVCDDEKKDLFVIASPNKKDKRENCEEDALLIRCVTRSLGWWSARGFRCNQFVKGTTIEELSSPDGVCAEGKNEYPLCNGYEDYVYEKVGLIPLDFLKKKIIRDRED